MSARDDYPLGREQGWGQTVYTIDPAVWKDMCDEIDRLRTENEQWRAQFKTVDEIRAEFDLMRRDITP